VTPPVPEPGRGGAGRPEGERGSGALARLVARAQAPLSGLEPLIAPRFAVPEGGLAADPGASGAGFGALAAAADDTAGPGGSRPSARPGSRPDGALVPDGQPAWPVPDPGRPVLGLDPRPGLVGPRDAAGSTGEGRPAQPAGYAPAAAWAGELAPRPGPGQPHQDAGLRRAAGPSAERGAGAPPAAPAAEITISIGHIEVRAAREPGSRPVPSPSRPAFRPRLALDDFLGDGGSGRR
jgi:translation initiation factor IF-2